MLATYRRSWHTSRVLITTFSSYLIAAVLLATRPHITPLYLALKLFVYYCVCAFPSFLDCIIFPSFFLSFFLWLHWFNDCFISPRFFLWLDCIDLLQALKMVRQLKGVSYSWVTHTPDGLSARNQSGGGGYSVYNPNPPYHINTPFDSNTPSHTNFPSI